MTGDSGGASPVRPPTGFERARAVADAVLFEGYVLYPYRASAPKNRLRWQFGVLAPPGADPSETSHAQTECLLVSRSAAPDVVVRVRFLQIQRRYARAPEERPWDEGVVREIDAGASLVPGVTVTVPFEVPGGDEEGRRRWQLSGVLRMRADRLPGPYDLLKVRIRVENRTVGPVTPRPEMLCRSLVGTHALLAAVQGRVLSLTDPPAWAAAAATGCDNQHAWPVLIDDSTLLSAPIILGDRPRIAPESPVDLHDGTEIDELLTLRTMTLTDAEKDEARRTDERAAAIIEHAEAVTPAVLERLHGVLRGPRRPEADAETDTGTDTESGSPATGRPVRPPGDAVRVPGGWAGPGARVRLRPGGRRADAQDMFLCDRTARVAAVLEDVDGGTHLAVTLDDDPAADLHESVGRHWYFAPDEVELL
ncbi:hypothetical protein [Streptomyces poonensis]|uniref:Uncharacterized protein n=1 Tax=Streptomyces poonensis TaxID=68255 RepID=A0A918PEL6_9ACTN|nr:hypothetical protein [Streptomyces poonensis]GGZ03831.1 hypothetical protein GCM10010365_23420 [Streptomyces poonensis]GLJ90781.1 hypothetical protein GCM10017589_33860 [Streptomyces poonensis]